MGDYVLQHFYNDPASFALPICAIVAWIGCTIGAYLEHRKEKEEERERAKYN